MNKHIELVEKWLADPDSVTQEKLEANAEKAAWAAKAAEGAAKGVVLATAGAAYWFKKYEEQSDFT